MSSSIVSEKSQDDPHRATEKRVGRISAVILPLLELGAVGFVTYLFTYLLCAQYLISPSPKFQRLGISPRNGIGIALITLFSVTLFMFLVCWARMTVAIYRNPGTLPLGASDVEKVATSARYLDKYSAYTCDHEGLPKWCKKCQNYKPDRVHHCKELDAT
jgi:palmitoyltransferase